MGEVRITLPSQNKTKKVKKKKKKKTKKKTKKSIVRGGFCDRDWLLRHNATYLGRSGWGVKKVLWGNYKRERFLT